jgi:hypothetical protein
MPSSWNRAAPIAALAGALAAAGLAAAARSAAAPQDAPAPDADLAKVERKILKEPKYVAAPKYALFVLDAEAKFKAWAVFDKSTPDAPFYDVLYFDRNGNGDLTEPDERFVGKRDPSLIPAGLEMLVKVGDVPVPGTALVHRGLRFSTSPKEGRIGFWFEMKWNGGTEVSGTYGPAGIDNAEFAESPEKAAIIHPDPNGTLAFALYGQKPVQLKIGSETHVAVLVGHPGLGKDSLAVVDENFLDLTKDELFATVVAKDAGGKEVTTTTRIRGHC